MGKNIKKDKFQRINLLRAKLSFDDGFAEHPIYVIKATTNEKKKGLYMLELIENNFNITIEDKRNEFIKKVREQDKIKWTRDEKGNIISPFNIKKFRT